MDETFNKILVFFSANPGKRLFPFLILILGMVSVVWGVAQLYAVGNVSEQICVGGQSSMRQEPGGIDVDGAKKLDDSDSESDFTSSTISAVENTNTARYIYIDVAGAVISPGIYQLESGSRVADALFKAGGVSTKIDKVFLAQKINLATVLEDGQKLYFPFVQELLCAEITATQAEETAGNQQSTVLADGQLSVNTATVEELDTLAGIGEKRAQQIVENRPYVSIDELVSKKIISQSIFDQIKNQLEL